MEIKLFTLHPVTSPFELGGLAFYGESGSFGRDCYRSQDMQMIFISLPNFSWLIRQNRSKYAFCSNVVFHYKKSGDFLVNDIIIARVSQIELLHCINKAINDAINLMRECGVDDNDAVMSDLLREQNDIATLTHCL